MPKIGGYDFTIGADPEVFLINKVTNTPVSAHNLIPGSKKAPHKVKYGAVQPDGLAAEFNIDPAKNYKEFSRNISEVMKSLEKLTPGYDFKAVPVMEFGAKYINSLPKEARILGCDPDFNAYTGRANPLPDANADFRTGAGHIHVGWSDPNNPGPRDPFDPTHFEACCWLTQAMDTWLGIPSIIWDEDQKRRSLYGKAGAFRPKPYGMEYRTLSNAWLNRPSTIMLVYENTVKAIESMFNDPNFRNKTFNGERAEDIINKGDEETAIHVLSYEGIHPARYYREILEKEAA